MSEICWTIIDQSHLQFSSDFDLFKFDRSDQICSEWHWLLQLPFNIQNFELSTAHPQFQNQREIKGMTLIIGSGISQPWTLRVLCVCLFVWCANNTVISALVTWVAEVFGRLACADWLSHECQGTEFPSRILCCGETLHVINFNCRCGF